MKTSDFFLSPPVLGTTITSSRPLVSQDIGRPTAINTNQGVISLSYPSSYTASAGNTFVFADALGTWATNNVTLTGFQLYGTVQDLTLNLSYGKITLTYVNSTTGWILSADIAPASTAMAPLSAPPLVGAATVDGLPLVKYDPVTKQLLTSTNTNVSSLLAPPLTNIVYTSGLLTSYQIGTTTYTFTYDSFNRPISITDGTSTQTLTYNSDGSIASLT
jgi:YD repeat-containing protein